ncbi:MAG: hypothetical protein M1380_04190 [Chloroflexi bacterium]|nr:hypothetical protein [Chloroflexota bacterium]
METVGQGGFSHRRRSFRPSETEDGWIVDIATQKYWRGKAQILDRFRSLERFRALQHVMAEDSAFDSEGSAMARTTSRVALVDPATGIERS